MSRPKLGQGQKLLLFHHVDMLWYGSSARASDFGTGPVVTKRAAAKIRKSPKSLREVRLPLRECDPMIRSSRNSGAACTITIFVSPFGMLAEVVG